MCTVPGTESQADERTGATSGERQGIFAVAHAGPSPSFDRAARPTKTEERNNNNDKNAAQAQNTDLFYGGGS